MLSAKAGKHTKNKTSVSTRSGPQATTQTSRRLAAFSSARANISSSASERVNKPRCTSACNSAESFSQARWLTSAARALWLALFLARLCLRPGPPPLPLPTALMSPVASTASSTIALPAS